MKIKISLTPDFLPETIMHDRPHNESVRVSPIMMGPQEISIDDGEFRIKGPFLAVWDKSQKVSQLIPLNRISSVQTFDTDGPMFIGMLDNLL